MPAAPKTSRSARCQKGSESINRPSRSKIAARKPTWYERSEARAEEQLGAVHVEIEQQRLVRVDDLQMRRELRPAETQREIPAPAVLQVRVVFGHRAVEVVGVGAEILPARRDRPALRHAEGGVDIQRGEDGRFRITLAVERARLPAFGLRLDDVQ